MAKFISKHLFCLLLIILSMDSHSAYVLKGCEITSLNPSATYEVRLIFAELCLTTADPQINTPYIIEDYFEGVLYTCDYAFYFLEGNEVYGLGNVR